MTTVVYHDVDGMRCNHLPQKLSVTLVADDDLDVLARVSAAAWLNVHTDYGGSGSEIVEPHREAAAAINADLKQCRRLASKACQMAFVNREIVSPLPNAWSLNVALEEGAEIAVV